MRGQLGLCSWSTQRRLVACAVVASVSLVCATAAGAAVRGIDVSHWNGAIDWSQVSAAGFQFAFAKATEGVSLVDPTYPINRDGATGVGMKVGAYHFARPAGNTSAAITASAIAQADALVDFAQPRSGDLLPVLDLEASGGLSAANLATWTQAWLAEVAARLGVRPILYTGPNFWRNSMGDTQAFSADLLWLAHYTSKSQPDIPAGGWAGNGWTFWQWTNCADIPGMAHCGDEDRFAGANLAQLSIPPSPPGPPSATAPPTIVGSAQTGLLLAAVPGSWTGAEPIAYSYQWQRCTSPGVACSLIAGATGESYRPTTADAGDPLTVQVTARNAAGTTSTSAAPTLPIAAAPGTVTAPVDVSPPTVTGTAEAGQTLAATSGSWNGSPTAYAYEWRRCDQTGANCAAIGGATAPNYAVTGADIGSTLQVLVTATNRSGQGTGTSTGTAVVTAAVPPTATGDTAAIQEGAAGTIATPNGVAASWQPGVLQATTTISIAAASLSVRRLAIRGTAATITVTPKPASALSWPLDVVFPAAAQSAIPGYSRDGSSWQAVPLLAAPVLPASQSLGYYRGQNADLHLLSRQAGVLALFVPTSWGDPRYQGTGRPKLTRLLTLNARRTPDGSAIVATRIRLDRQAHLYLNVLDPSGDRLRLLQQGSRIGLRLAGPPAKTLQTLALVPGSRPLRLHLPSGELSAGTRYRIRITVFDPQGRRATLTLSFRLR